VVKKPSNPPSDIFKRQRAPNENGPRSRGPLDPDE
jgi:hypothetical protein